jgi:predicted oxidoreductase (fatty acid repression mutant protein)
MQQAFPAYAHLFPGWATESTAMHEYAIWTALEAEGLGANLQHYFSVNEAMVRETHGLSSQWEQRAEMVIGKPDPAGPPGEKTFLPVEGERLLIKGL